MRLSYPPTRTVDVVDELHGTRVPDPYRWLEDLDGPETRAWIDAQNAVAFGFLERIPARAAIRARLTALWNYERYGRPGKEGGRYFFFKNDGLQNQPVLYVAPALGAEPRVLLDPNQLSPDGTVALVGHAVSRDGRRLAYGLSQGGSDWTEWRVREVDTGEELPDLVRWVKFSGASFTPDGRGFFYSRYDEPRPGDELGGANYWHKLYYHRLGTAQADDELVYERRDQREWGFSGAVSEDGRWLVIGVWKGTDPKNQIFYLDLAAPERRVVELITGFANGYEYLGNDGPIFWFRTDLDAPRGRVIAVDTRDPDPRRWRELVPQAAETIDSASVVGDHLVVSYLKDARALVRVFTLEGAHVRDVALPGLGSVHGFGGRRDDPETFYSYTDFTTPETIYRYDVVTGESTPVWRPKVDFDPTAYQTRQVFYTSRDGTRVPMFVTHRKGLARDGNAPTYLYGYGGFNIPLTPTFDVSSLVWMELGGVLAVANLRGGGEYGEEWHRAGTRLEKQNVFDDFIAAAEWLIACGLTRPSKLAIGGGSNGGLLVGACLTQRPELFGAAMPNVGVLDMLRFHKFTIGWAWVDDYGSADDPEEFRALLAYSPYHNVRKGVRYPATLITTGDHDDRVVPAHSYKFAAALQAAQAGDAPVLLRVDVRTGHGQGKPTSKLIDLVTDRWAFLVQVLDVPVRGFGHHPETGERA